MSRGGMFNLATFSRPRTPVAFRKLTLQSCARVSGVSGEEKDQCVSVAIRRGNMHTAMVELEEPER